MKLSGILVVACLTSCATIAAWLAPAEASAALVGMTAPLVAGVGTILLVERTTRTDMRRLTGRMTLAFVAKMLFYPPYVVVALIGLQLDPVAFLISFTLYFITLHLTEALYFKSLFARASSTNAVG